MNYSGTGVYRIVQLSVCEGRMALLTAWWYVVLKKKPVDHFLAAYKPKIKDRLWIDWFMATCLHV